MPAQPLVYEGPDLEQLLGEIISVHGSNVRLGEPTKVRKGGVGGFFATVHYRVEVHPLETPAVAPQPVVAAPPPVAAPREDPVVSPEVEVDPEQARREAAARRAALAPRELDELGIEASTTIDALEAMAAGTPDVFELTSPTPARPRSFDDALAAAAASLGDDPRVGSLGFDANDELILANPGLDVQPEVARRAAPAADPTPAAPLREAAPTAFAPPPATQVAAPPVAAAPLTAPPRTEPAQPEPLRPEPLRVEPWQPEQERSDPLVSGTPSGATPGAAPLRFTSPNETSGPDSDATGVVHDLLAVGLPVAIGSAALGRYDAALTMEHAFSMLPIARQLPLTPGSLIAIVGPANRAFDVARSMAAAIGITESEIAFVSGEPKRNPPKVKFAPDLVAHDVRGVEDLSPGWRRGRVAVVAVSCPVLSGEHRVVRDLLEAMRPSATIAIADARSKSEDVAYFCDGLGGVDALVLDRVTETLTPASLTTTGIPVARLGDAPASPEEWARLATFALRRRRGEAVDG